MCYTYQHSVVSLFVGLIVSLYLFIQPNVNLKIVGGFFFFVSWMQLFDAIFWKHLQGGRTNAIATKFACIFNHLQPLILAALIYYYRGGIQSKVSKILIGLYAVSILIYTVSNWKRLNTTTVTAKSAPSLDWSWNHWKYAPYVYALFLVTLMWLMYRHLNRPYNLIGSLLVFISFMFSMYKYQIQQSTGRFWCYFAAFAPLVFLFISKLQSK